MRSKTLIFDHHYKILTYFGAQLLGLLHNELRNNKQSRIKKDECGLQNYFVLQFTTLTILEVRSVQRGRRSFLARIWASRWRKLVLQFNVFGEFLFIYLFIVRKNECHKLIHCIIRVDLFDKYEWMCNLFQRASLLIKAIALFFNFRKWNLWFVMFSPTPA